MLRISSFKRSGSNCKTTLLCNEKGEGATENEIEGGFGEAPPQRDFEALCVSKHLVRSVSQKLMKQRQRGNAEEEVGLGNEKKASSRCLTLCGKGGGCKVSADMGDDICNGNNIRKSNVGEERMRFHDISGIDEVRVDCFSYGMADRFWKRSSRKAKEIEQCLPSSPIQFSPPDDILEMCLVRLPLISLMTARLVCKKWTSLTSTPHFMQMRREGLHQSPWLFLFGVVKDGLCSGQIHALDVCLDQWRTIDASILKGRFSFSVASIGDDVYIVGGCSSLANFGRVDKSSFKTHRGVMMFSPLTGSWRKTSSMKSARSRPVVGVFEVNHDCLSFQNRHERKDQHFSKSRVGGVSDVYEDPHRLSVRRQLQDTPIETEASLESKRKPYKSLKQESNNSNAKVCKQYVLIVVGGQGTWDEPLDSGEVYDPLSNKWMDIPRLPGDFGVVCSGSVCNGMFYVYSETDKLAAYHLDSGRWVVIQTIRFPLRLHEYHPKLVSCFGRLFMLCVSWCERDGNIIRREKAVRKLWELDLTYHTWTEVSRHPDAPMDWNAAFVADKDRIFGVEMFKIFGQVLDFLTICDASDPELKWTRISRKHMAHEVDASSCTTKTMAVLHL